MQASRSKLLNWFSLNKRDLPWRFENPQRDPYKVWVSEIMLQQTQVTTVIPYFKKWMKKFPTLKKLAQADEAEVLEYWAGLGYYSRARNLQKGSQYIIEFHDGIVPSKVSELLDIPGVGDYTAGAISSLAYEKQSPILDGNLIRIFSRFYNSKEPFWDSKGKKTYWDYSNEWIKESKAKKVNEALMELGALVCKPKNPDCDSCPLKLECLAQKKSNQLEFPVKKPKKPKVNLDIALFILSYNKRVYRVKGMSTLLKKEWSLFNSNQDEVSNLIDQFKPFSKIIWNSNDHRISHAITNHKIKAQVIHIDLKEVPGFLIKGKEHWVSENYSWTSSIMVKAIELWRKENA